MYCSIQVYQRLHGFSPIWEFPYKERNVLPWCTGIWTNCVATTRKHPCQRRVSSWMHQARTFKRRLTWSVYPAVWIPGPLTVPGTAGANDKPMVISHTIVRWLMDAFYFTRQPYAIILRKALLYISLRCARLCPELVGLWNSLTNWIKFIALPKKNNYQRQHT